MTVDFKLRVLHCAVFPAALAMLAAGACAQTGSAPAPSAATDTPVAIAVGDGPAGIAFGPDGKRLYVTSNGDNTVAVIDVAAGRRLRELGERPAKAVKDGCPHNFCRGTGAAGIAIAADERHAYVSSMHADSLAKLDLDSGQVDGVAKVQRFPQAVAVSPDGTRAYVLNVVANSVSVVDLATFRTLGKPIALSGGNAGNQPFGRPAALALSPDGGRLFVTNGVAGSIDAFDTRTRAPVGTIANADAFDVAVQPGSGELVARFRDGVATYDANTLKPRQAARYCRALTSYHVAFSPDGRLIALSLPQENTALVAERATGMLRAAYRTGEWPLALAFNQDGSRLAVLNANESSVLLFDVRDAGRLADYMAANGELFCQPAAPAVSQ
ncbi:beta-propeller fold lactonase family protein [Burkholderia sp. BCC1047]|uniref:beta-propeller fold lactonase family protein n=1 Tax=Burkholderia sp. BCC1047 TaxID=2676299 RepID=UPI00158D2EDA|nr:beta-propeller fold lactonase family protein [Burkholderia sp. BCC1047]